MTVAVPPGEGYLLLIYEDTPPRQLGGALSITAAIAGAGRVEPLGDTLAAYHLAGPIHLAHAHPTTYALPPARYPYEPVPC